MGKLTALAIKSASQAGRHQDGDGLQLLVKPGGAKSWVLRIQANGKRRDIGLGSASQVTLREAREKADELKRMYRKGADPLQERRTAKAAAAELPTFREAALVAHQEHQGGWRNVKHHADWLSSLERYAFPEIGRVRIDVVTAPMIRDILLPIWLDRPETARRVRQRVKLVVDWASAKGYIPHLELGGITKALPRQPKSDNHFAAMPFEEVPGFVGSLRESKETISRLALQFLILTAARSGEVRGAQWNELDLAARTWTVPSIRMKAGTCHVVPLSEPAVAILTHLAPLQLHRESIVFPGTKGQSLSDMTLLKIMRDRSLPFSVHGFRAAFKTWAVEVTSYPNAVSEEALAHIDANKVRAAYSRTDFREKRIGLMNAWADFIG